MVIVGEPATRHRGEGELRSVEPLRWAWVVVTGTILLGVLSEMAVAAWTTPMLHGLGLPALWVALVGCAVGTAGIVVMFLVERSQHVPFEHLATGPACGAAISVLLGEAWLVGSHSTLIVTAALIVTVDGMALLVRRATVSRSAVLWAGCASAVAVAVTASLYVIPDGPSLNFRWNNEGQLNRLVPEADKLLSNSNSSPGSCREWQPPAIEKILGAASRLCGVPGQFYVTDALGRWSVMFDSKGAETCERHLDGPWWETVSTGGELSCPVGFNFVGSG